MSNKNNAARFLGLVVRECKRMRFESLFNVEREKRERGKRGVSRSFGMGWEVTMFSCMIGLLRFFVQMDCVLMHAVNAACKSPLNEAALRAQTGPPGRGRITGLGVCV